MISSTVYNDRRFWKPIDDPKGDESDPAQMIMCLPIIEKKKEGQIVEPLPKGIITAINKIGKNSFSLYDIAAIKSYNNFLSKVIEIAA